MSHAAIIARLDPGSFTHALAASCAEAPRAPTGVAPLAALRFGPSPAEA